ncbi:MAG: hypothetical protein JWM86_492 [Thermoleophilia bacterium]|nr:hypothetical protein [Thermoleophilia bacterium]
MQLSRPILSIWRSTPWVAATPVDDRTIGGILRDEVQVEFRGTGRMSERELVPLTPAARELLHGPERVAAQRALRGVLATLDGREGASNLRGISLSSDQSSFAANLLMSNTEAGFVDDAVRAGDRAGFERAMVSLIPSVQVAKAQNTGWIDLGPRVSSMLRDVIGRGPDAGRDAANEVSLTLLHELQHSVTAPDPRTIDDRHVWLEEGIAETLAWWPGAAGAMRDRLGVPTRPGEVIDPFSAPPDSVASAEYRGRHRTVQGLLGLAGIEPYDRAGAIDPTASARATALLQGDGIERVPRNLSRAIIREHRLDPALEPTVRGLILDTAGDPSSVDALAELLGIPTA